MRAVKLLVQLVIYYALIFGGVYLVLKAYPDMRSWLPIGGAMELIKSEPAKDLAGAVASSVETAQGVDNLGESLGWLAVAIIGALLTALPVSWVYMATRTDEEYDQSLISSVLILPVVVTSIVVVIQHSLALAFALGGIAGAVRFKNSLKSSGDALYILLSIGIGLASGIGAVELAFIMALAFNFAILALWVSEFGERAGMKRFMTDFDPTTCPDPSPPPADAATATAPGEPPKT
jgi:hypothetical protein